MTYISPSMGARASLMLSASFAIFAVAAPAMAQDTGAQAEPQQQSVPSAASSDTSCGRLALNESVHLLTAIR